MFSIYILLNKNHQKTYVGYAKDIFKRLACHNSGEVVSTRYYRPWDIVYSEIVNSLKEAKQREKYWKSGAGRRNIRKILEGSRPTFRKLGEALASLDASRSGRSNLL